MKPRVYLETTVPSYLTAWPSRDLVRAAHQQITREWWDQRRPQFELFISQIVLRECQAGVELHAYCQRDAARSDRVGLPGEWLRAVGDLHTGRASIGRRLNVDDVLLEVRKVREAYAQRFGYDLVAIHRDLKEQEQVGGRRIVSLPPRRPKPVTANGDVAGTT